MVSYVGDPVSGPSAVACRGPPVDRGSRLDPDSRPLDSILLYSAVQYTYGYNIYSYIMDRFLSMDQIRDIRICVIASIRESAGNDDR